METYMEAEKAFRKFLLYPYPLLFTFFGFLFMATARDEIPKKRSEVLV